MASPIYTASELLAVMSSRLLKDGQIVFMLERWQIEGHSADSIAAELTRAFDQHCAGAGVG